MKGTLVARQVGVTDGHRDYGSWRSIGRTNRCVCIVQKE